MMFDEVEELRLKCARFYKVDLHHHSPLSHDWNNEETPSNTPKNTLLDKLASVDEISDNKLEAYYEELRKAKIDVVAITDHMKYSFGVALCDYASRIDGEITILPGIELSVKINQPLISDCRIHLIAIFPPTKKDEIDRIFPADIPHEKERSGTEELTVNSISDITDKVHELDGKVIAAHIYGNYGLRAEYTNSAKLILKPLSEIEDGACEKFYQNVGDTVKSELYKTNCLQVTETTDPIHFKDEADNLVIPLVIASDAHHVKDFQSTKITYMKMGQPDYQSLNESFKYPDTRIRFTSNLPEIKPPRIRGIRIVGQRDNERAFFKNITVGFSDNLTCIVGPRGSGKSALIDGIRYAMGYNRTLDQVEKVKDQVIERQSYTLQNSRIEILYEKSDGTLHIIESTYDPRESYNTKVFDLDKNEINIDDVEACGEYPLNLYGWNELELLGEDPSAQREMIDRFIDGLSELKTEKTLLYQDLRSNAIKCLQLIEDTDSYFDPSKQSTSFLRLKEFEAEFNKLNTPEIATVFEKLDSRDKSISFLKELEEEINKVLNEIEKIPLIVYEDILSKYQDISEWGKAFINYILKAKKLNDDLIEKKSYLGGKIQAQLEIISTELAQLEEDRSSAYKEIRSVIGEDEKAISVELRSTAKKRADAATDEFERYKKEIAAIKEALDKRATLIDRIKELNQRIFAIRDEKISYIIENIQIVNDENYKITLNIEQGNDRDDFINALYDRSLGLIFEGQWKNKRIPDVIANKLSPFTLATAIVRNQPDQIVNSLEIDDKKYDIDVDYASKFIENNSPIEVLSDLEIERFNKGKFKSIFDLEQVEYDDVFYILLNEKAIQHCSPGQRCSAMLPLVTLTSNAPIIIDQPEDNLDNRLVSRAVFKILARLKESRQIIVATHNPNILVSGDAEQVFVLNSNGVIDAYGSIDDQDIIESVVELMEGGKEAFDKRREKYKDFL